MLNSRCHHEENSDWAGLIPLWSKAIITRDWSTLERMDYMLWNNPSLHYEHVLLSLANRKLTGR